MSKVLAQDTHYYQNKYSEICITLLARDPNCLYVHWNVTEDRKNAFLKDFGQELWDKSIPTLKVINISKNESFFVRVNDFSNSWYIQVPDANSIYVVELGRRVSEHFFVSLSNSNCIITPRNNVSHNETVYYVNYTDFKTGKFNFITKEVSEPDLLLDYPELNSLVQKDNYFGDSSAGLYNINLSNKPGVSSESFIK